MKNYGLIGYPLEHSFSQKIFEEKFRKEQIQASYSLFPLPEIKEFPKWISSQTQLSGLQVTLPHKEKIIPYLNDLDPHAQKIAAVNTLKKTKQGWIGYNTDYQGFKDSLSDFYPSGKVLILGTGGAAKAVQAVFQDMNIPYDLMSRQTSPKTLSYSLFQTKPKAIQSYAMIINATPLGMHPHPKTTPPLPYQELLGHQKLYDLVYNPSPSFFLKKGLEKGCPIKDGQEMLLRQAHISWEIWTGK
ncbi:MAG: shikimate dehydrogenase [Cytophagales bacterium]|nr:shikimate dehydrogenase [Cytophagales bacterium]